MSFLPYPPTSTTAAIEVFRQDVGLTHEVVHGSDTATVLTEGGTIPTINKLIKDINDRVDSSILESGFYPATGSFETGGTITERNQVLLRSTAPASFFSWGGPLPKVVPAGSTVTGAGGESVNGWTNRNDATFKTALADVNSQELIAGNLAKRMTVTVASIKDLQYVQRNTEITYIVTGFYSGSTDGGGNFRWNPSSSYTSHDGGVKIALPSLEIFNGSRLTLTEFLNWVGSGNGCFERINLNEITPFMFGADDSSDCTLEVSRSYLSANKYNLKNIFKKFISVSQTINIPSGVYSEMIGGGVKALVSSFADGSPVLKLGDFALGVSGQWQGEAGVLSVDCNGTNSMGIDFGYTWKKCEVIHASVFNHANIGILHSKGYGLKLLAYTIFAVSKYFGWAFNAPTNSIGLLTNTTDNYYGPCQVFGSFIGIKAVGGSNHFANPHCWGIYKDASGQDKACPMGIPIWNLGQSNSWDNPISDSPSMIDYSIAASETNGGFGIYNSSNGFQTKFISPMVFIPNRTSENEIYPVNKIAPYRCNQSATYLAAEVFDDSPSKNVLISNTFSGANVSTCNIMGRSVFDVYSVPIANFKRQVSMSRGLDIQTTYVDTDSKINSFGMINFRTIDQKYVRLNTNYEGNISEIRLERQSRGSSGDRSFLATILGTDDQGYMFYLTDTKKINVWDGENWRETNGDLVT